MKILLGITGGIAAYKMLTVIRILVKSGHEVKVIMTPHACEFITPLTVKSLSDNEVYVQDFKLDVPIAHINLADWADIFAIAPATANTLAKIAHGIADNLLTSVMLAFSGRKMLFPAMNVNMYNNLQTRENLKKLELQGFEIIEPDSGDLACGYTGEGRLPEPELVAGMIDRLPDSALADRLYIVTAGATREEIDPVRFLSNNSSGLMGTELAVELYRRGADVILIHGQMKTPAPAYLSSVEVGSTEELLNAIRHHMPQAKGLYMAAAPADFRALDPQNHKIKKKKTLELQLHATTDVLSAITEEFQDRLIVGFALESENGEKNAAEKLKKKNMDFVVLNRIQEDFNPMGNELNQITLLDKDNHPVESGIMSKKEIAAFILDHTLDMEQVI